MTTALPEQLTKHLAEAHLLEEQALAQLRTAPDLAGDPELAELYGRHLVGTEGHGGRIRGLFESRNAEPSRIKDLIMAIGGQGFVLFARAQPDTPGKLHAHSISFEALEIASHELLSRVAQRARRS
jgi:ferritin-like metal-binding protein YciE